MCGLSSTGLVFHLLHIFLIAWVDVYSGSMKYWSGFLASNIFQGIFCLIIKLCLKSGLVGYSNLLLCTFVESFSRNRTNFYIVIWHKQIRVTWLWRLLILHTVSTVHITVQYRFWWGIWDICCFDGLFTFMIHVLLHDETFVFADCRCWSYHFSTEKHAEPANANAQHCRSQRKLLVTNSHKRTLLLLGVNFVSSHLELPQINFHC